MSVFIAPPSFPTNYSPNEMVDIQRRAHAEKPNSKGLELTLDDWRYAEQNHTAAELDAIVQQWVQELPIMLEKVMHNKSEKFDGDFLSKESIAKLKTEISSRDFERLERFLPHS